MKDCGEFNLKEFFIRMVKSKQRNKILYGLFLFEVLVAFILFVFMKKFSFILAAFSIMTYLFSVILDVLDKRKEETIRKNSLFDLLMSDKAFVTNFLYWGIEFPIIFTVINAVYAHINQMGLSAVLLTRRMEQSDWLLILVFLLVFCVNRPLGKWISNYYEEQLIQE